MHIDPVRSRFIEEGVAPCRGDAFANRRMRHSENEIQPLIFRGNPAGDFFIL
ncbi:hypothetical protein [Variovorax sp. Varisp36]|jgi:hypothetical protein|uniref:hypothetical protein n=1 Tax=Variovorax sp. Varisp36 TaxID=3243031 RepID=UPI0039A7564C